MLVEGSKGAKHVVLPVIRTSATAAVSFGSVSFQVQICASRNMTASIFVSQMEILTFASVKSAMC